MELIKTLLIRQDCNTKQQIVRNAFREGEERQALLNLYTARKHGGADSFFLANITPVDEDDFSRKYACLMNESPQDNTMTDNNAAENKPSADSEAIRQEVTEKLNGLSYDVFQTYLAGLIRVDLGISFDAIKNENTINALQCANLHTDADRLEALSEGSTEFIYCPRSGTHLLFSAQSNTYLSIVTTEMVESEHIELAAIPTFEWAMFECDFGESQ
jgi:hypothetical protein